MSAQHPTAIHRRVAALRAGSDPTFIARLRSGWAVLGDPQVIHGYCLLLPDPVVPQLNALVGAERTAFLADMALLGDAALAACGALRVNYAIYGNQDPALHAHVFPRRADEPPALATQQPWAWDWQSAPAFAPAVHAALLAALRRELERRGGS
jgi:diadenosine tetraphosphate (Ap4A) HIT family hydrolase